ncbi:hypothetical protein BCR42DRAFT_421330 [Absidia repens]|uniref:Uncharacterized protein n=1 Tax=Absidia repens TaxID=90262 RepID=A0A1X2I8D7_9FUNG|nr:hypothetical protein BCR42DRAFT_421330 [Absidia repens]
MVLTSFLKQSLPCQRQHRDVFLTVTPLHTLSATNNGNSWVILVAIIMDLISGLFISVLLATITILCSYVS